MKHTPEFLALVNAAKEAVKEITIDEYLQNHKSVTIIDVREDDEWERGHLPNATHLGKGIIERDIETRFPNKDTQLILYCGGGFRSALAAHSIQKMGYRNVLSLAGGVRAWIEGGRSLDTKEYTETV
jgi:rhodanese-related sulfurtransferase